MIKFKEFYVGDNNYEEQLEQFQTEHPTAEFVQITGGYTSYEKIWFKYEASDISDKLSVEKIQEHLLPYEKETVQKIIDEKMQLVTADEFLKLHKESLTAIRENDKLQEQLNTAKKALTEIAEIIDDNIHECNYGCDNSCELNGSLDMYSVENVQSVIDSALAAIGWGGCPVGAVGVNGLTKEEIEGSGDE